MIQRNKIFLLSLLLHPILFFLFRTNKWIIRGQNRFEFAIKAKTPIMLCSWHQRFLYAIYFLKKYKVKNVWAVSSTHPDSQIMAYFLKRSSFHLIKGSSTRGEKNVIKKMLAIFKLPYAIIAITNDGPKGPPNVAKLGSYKVALKSKAQIVSITCSSSTFWEIKSWDKLRIPKPFGTIYVDFSNSMNINEDYNNIKDADALTTFLNENSERLDKTIL